MATALSLHPVFRSSVGFDRFNDLFETLASEQHNKSSYPPYNIVKTSENDYKIEVALAGYKENEISICYESDTLTVSGKKHKSDETDSTKYLHRGIAERNFERSFRLDDNMKVNNASLTDGLLTISVERIIPEEKKPQLITINKH